MKNIAALYRIRSSKCLTLIAVFELALARKLSAAWVGRPALAECLSDRTRSNLDPPLSA